MATKPEAPRSLPPKTASTNSPRRVAQPARVTTEAASPKRATAGIAAKTTKARDRAPRVLVAEAPRVDAVADTSEAESSARAMDTIGLDIGKRKIFIASATSGVVKRRHQVTSISQLILWLGRNTCTVCFEACRGGWDIHDRLEAAGHKVVMLDTTRLAQVGIGQHGRKNDRIDADRIAEAISMGRVPKAHILSKDRRRLRFLVNNRATFVEARARYVVTARGHLSACGIEVDCDADMFVERASRLELPDSVSEFVRPLLEAIVFTTRQMNQADRALIECVDGDPTAQLLMTAPGVGPVVAAAFISVIDDAGRFKSAGQVASYLGLVPSEDSSGATGQRLGRITKAGNSQARSLLVQAGHVILNLKQQHWHDPLYIWGHQVKARRQKTNIAAVALARRLCETLWSMWKNKKVYDPDYAARRTADGIERDAAQKLNVAAQLRKLDGRKRLRASAQRRVENITARAEAVLRTPRGDEKKTQTKNPKAKAMKLLPTTRPLHGARSSEEALDQDLFR